MDIYDGKTGEFKPFQSYVKNIHAKSISREFMPVGSIDGGVDYLPECETTIRYLVVFVNGEVVEMEKSYYPDELPTFNNAEKWLREYWGC